VRDDGICLASLVSVVKDNSSLFRLVDSPPLCGTSVGRRVGLGFGGGIGWITRNWGAFAADGPMALSGRGRLVTVPTLLLSGGENAVVCFTCWHARKCLFEALGLATAGAVTAAASPSGDVPGAPVVWRGQQCQCQCDDGGPVALGRRGQQRRRHCCGGLPRAPTGWRGQWRRDPRDSVSSRRPAAASLGRGRALCSPGRGRDHRNCECWRWG
jgi:hypothetical protein